MSKLSPCKTCGHQVAKGAKTCPSCGAEWPAGNPRAAGCLVVLVLFAIFYFATTNLGGSSAASNIEDELGIQLVGFFSSDSGDRAITFNVTKPMSNLSAMSAKLREHGASQTHASGGHTYSTYHVTPKRAPDISRLSNLLEANAAAWDAGPFLRVHILRDGTVMTDAP